MSNDADVFGEDMPGIHRAPENNRGHLYMAHKHLLSMTPEGIEVADWSRIVAAYSLLRAVGEANGHPGMPMEAYDDRGPRRYRCDTCASVLLSRRAPEPDDKQFHTARNPEHCPFCRYGTPELVEGPEHKADRLPTVEGGE